MTDQKLDDLRKWSAELMGWELKESVDEYGNKSGEWFNDGKYTGYDAYYIQSDGEDISESLTWIWQPDKDLNQTFMVVERMRELGFMFNLNAQAHFATKDYIPQFHTIDKPLKHGLARNSNPCLAILQEAYATGVK